MQGKAIRRELFYINFKPSFAPLSLERGRDKSDNPMITNLTNTEKRRYNPPMMERIKLDNAISLALASAPPAGPFESGNSAPGYFNNDPFKTTLV